MYTKILKYIIYAGIFATPFISLYVANSLFFPFITGKNFVFRIIVEIIFCAWLILALRDRKFLPKISSILWTFIIFLGVIALADIFSLNPSKSMWSNYERMEGLVTHVHLFFYFVVIGSMLSTFRLWSWFLHTSIGVSVFMVFYSILQLGHELVINQGGVRIDGTLGNAAYLGVYLLFHIFILLFFCYSNRARLKEILWSLIGGCGGFILFYLYHTSDPHIGMNKTGIILLFVSLFIIGCGWFFLSLEKRKPLPGYFKIALYGFLILVEVCILFFTATRGAILGFIFGMIFISVMLAFLEKENKILKKINIILLIAIIFLGGALISLKDADFVKKNQTLSRFSSLLNSDIKTFFSTGEGKSRYLNGKAALQGFKERPLGWGQESFNYVFYTYYDPKMYNEEAWFDRAHNIIFDWLVAGGIAGLLSYFSLFFFALIFLLGRKNNEKNLLSFGERVVLSGILIAYFIQNLTVFDNITSYLLFFSLLAFIHFVYGKSLNGDKMLKANNKILMRMVTPIVFVGLLFSLYFVNVKAILASQNLIRALSFQEINPEKSLEYYKKALSYNSFGDSEIREFLSQTSQQVFVSNADAKIKNDFHVLLKSEFEKQLKETPEDVRYYYLAGIALGKIGRVEDSILYLEKASALSPKKQIILLELAVDYLNLGDYKKAEEILKKTYELEPDFDQVKVFYALSSIYNKNETLARSLFGEKRYEELLLTDQRFPSALVGSGQYARAISLWKKWIEKDSHNIQYRLALANTYLRADDKENAILQLQKAVEIEPRLKEQSEELIKKIREGKSI